MGTERIEKAAIWHRGIVYTVPAPGRHHNVMLMMAEKYRLGPEAQRHQGFSTSLGRYVDRKQAWRIAQEADQLLERAPTDGRGGTLYSEDVW